MNERVKGDDEIINEFSNGSVKSLSVIFNLHYTQLCFFAQRLIEDREEAEDIVADAFVRLWERRPAVRSMQNVKSYLYIATRNACFNYLKKLVRTNKKQSELMYLISGREDHTLDEMIKAEVFDKVYKALESLPPQCKKIAWLSFIDGLKNHEIADQLNLSVQTVKNQKMRAISLLKMRLLDGNVFFLLWLYSHLSNKL